MTATPLFALATGAVRLPDKQDALVRLGAIAADVVARAVMRGVYEAEGVGEIAGYRGAARAESTHSRRRRVAHGKAGNTGSGSA